MRCKFMLTLSHTFSCQGGGGTWCQGINSKKVRWKISKSVLSLVGGGHDSPESKRAHTWNQINCLWTTHSFSCSVYVMRHSQECRLVWRCYSLSLGADWAGSQESLGQSWTDNNFLHTLGKFLALLCLTLFVAEGDKEKLTNSAVM